MNYSEKFNIYDTVWFKDEKAVIVFVHPDTLVNLKVEGNPYFIYGIHAPSSLKLRKTINCECYQLNNFNDEIIGMDTCIQCNKIIIRK